MSGASLAAGARKAKRGELQQRGNEGGSMGGVMGSLRIVELQLVAFIVVFSASGVVPLLDLVFPIFITLYAFLLSYAVFPKYSKESSSEIFQGSRLFQIYISLGTVIGLFLPLAYVLGAFARGDQQSVRAATPHLFLLSFQVLKENLISSNNIFSSPVRAILLILYNGRRLFSLSAWLSAVFGRAQLPPNPKLSDKAWLGFGRGLAVVNSVYFAINLFGFLIPMFLPRAFEKYFEERNAHRAHVAAAAGAGAEHTEAAKAADDQKKAA